MLAYLFSTLFAVMLVVVLVGLIQVFLVGSRTLLDRLAMHWFDAPENSWIQRKAEGYFEDAMMGLHKRIQWTCGQPTLWRDLSWIQYRVERRLFALIWDTYGTVGSWWYRHAFYNPLTF